MIKKAVSIASLGIAVVESAWAHPGSSAHEGLASHHVVEHANLLLVIVVVLASASLVFAKMRSPRQSTAPTPGGTRTADPQVRNFAQN